MKGKEMKQKLNLKNLVFGTKKMALFRFSLLN